MSKIFSGEDSRKMWSEINSADTIDDIKAALYTIGCRLQAFEHKVVTLSPQPKDEPADISIRTDPVRFIKRPDCYLDTKTGLEWSLVNYGPMKWHNAMDQFDGPKGWRVPTIEELLTLVDYTKHDPATELPWMVSAYCWSSTTSADLTRYAWRVGFNYGYAYCDFKYYSHYVRAVRGGQEGEER
jgi:hypothetical protein